MKHWCWRGNETLVLKGMRFCIFSYAYVYIYIHHIYIYLYIYIYIYRYTYTYTIHTYTVYIYTYTTYIQWSMWALVSKFFHNVPSPSCASQSVKPMVVSIDAIAASSPRISRPPEGWMSHQPLPPWWSYGLLVSSGLLKKWKGWFWVLMRIFCLQTHIACLTRWSQWWFFFWCLLVDGHETSRNL